MNSIRAIKITIFVLILALFFPFVRVYSQAVINKIIITDLDYSRFPEIVTRVRVLDDAGLPYRGLTDKDLKVKEDNREVAASVMPTRVGIKTALVLDAGAGINASGATRNPRIEEMKTAAQKFIDTMGDGDAAEIILVRPNGMTVIQPLTGDKNVLTDVIKNLNLDSQAGLSNGLLGIDKALTDLNNSSGDVTAMSVLVLSSNIQAGQITEYDKIEKSAKDAGIPLHTILFNRSENQVLGLKELASNTGGWYTFYNSPTAVDKLYKRLNDERDQYQISYRSPSSTDSQRILAISANSDAPGAPGDRYPFVVTPAPQQPVVTNFLVNNGDPIVRKSSDGSTDPVTFEPTETQVKVGLGWNDDYGLRKIKWVELLVDGNLEGQRIENPGKIVIFPWNLRSYTQDGDETVKLSVRGEDEFGMAFNSDELPTTVKVEIPTPIATATPTVAPCLNEPNTIAKLFCQVRDYSSKNLVSLISIVIAIVALILVIVLLLRNKTTVKEAYSTFRNVVVNTFRINLATPKAYLHLISGTTGSSRTTFELYGATKIGRDERLVGGQESLIFTNSVITGFHCSIKEVDGQFFLRDENSSNGTYINGVRISEDFVELNEGDRIELAQVERGGLMFTFSFDKGMSETPVDPGTDTVRNR